MVDLLDNILNLLKLGHCYDREWEGLEEEDEQQTGYSLSGERWRKKAEAKAFVNKERYKNI